MPKRVVDGEGVWRSDKLAKVDPDWMRAEFANLIPLALANGTFEAEPRRVWSVVYSYNRPCVTVETVEQILRAYQAAGMLFLWTDSSTMKVWGYFPGIEKPGRLPAQSRLKKKHEAIGPEPPESDLRHYLESTRNSTASQWVSTGQPMASNALALALASGSCTGSGKTSSSEVKSTSGQEKDSDSASIGNAKKKTQPSHEAEKLATLLQREILRNKPDYRITPAELRKWAVTADRMIRLDRRTEESIAQLIQWVQRDEFWMSNVLSMDKLREKFDQLEMRRTSASKGGGRNCPTSQHASFEHIDYTAGREKNEDGSLRF